MELHNGLLCKLPAGVFTQRNPPYRYDRDIDIEVIAKDKDGTPWEGRGFYDGIEGFGPIKPEPKKTYLQQWKPPKPITEGRWIQDPKYPPFTKPPIYIPPPTEEELKKKKAEIAEMVARHEIALKEETERLKVEALQKLEERRKKAEYQIVVTAALFA